MQSEHVSLILTILPVDPAIKPPLLEITTTGKDGAVVEGSLARLRNRVA